ncbi:hypothetical protein TWF569_000278 [Orbilia oligospora]|nr:hypothetical protein TWF569_000278 [Orbilia oligospora]
MKLMMLLHDATKWLQSTLSTFARPSTPRSISADHNHNRSHSTLSIASTTTSESKPLLSASNVLSIAPTVARHTLRTCIHFSVPSFLQPTTPSTPILPANQTSLSRASRPHMLSSTAYLDGLRGTAAFLVFIYHFVYGYFPTLEAGFGYRPTDMNPLQLPIIRLYMCGASMVSIFFVISGYVLSYKSTTLIRRREYSSLLSTLSSSTFRRAIRLFLPTLVSVLSIAVLIQCGAFTWAWKHARHKKEILGWREQDPPILTGFSRQMKDAFWAWARMSNPFIWKEYFITYDPHLWTIPVEFRCSMVVFLSLLGLSKVKSWVRLTTLSIIAFTCLFHLGRWDVCLFLSGSVLAELTIIRSEKKIKGNSYMLFPILLLGLYLASQPAHEPGKTPGYRMITYYTPKAVSEKARFWPAIAAIIIVFALSSSTPKGLQRPFTTGFAQYLGKISYALYLVHGPVCRSLGYWSVIKIWEYTGRTTTAGYIGGVLGGGVLVFATVFWVSDIFWRIVDVGCVKLARWIESICLVKTDGPSEKIIN